METLLEGIELLEQFEEFCVSRGRDNEALSQAINKLIDDSEQLERPYEANSAGAHVGGAPTE